LPKPAFESDTERASVKLHLIDIYHNITICLFGPSALAKQLLATSWIDMRGAKTIWTFFLLNVAFGHCSSIQQVVSIFQDIIWPFFRK
jgi:hypothetical protein